MLNLESFEKSKNKIKIISLVVIVLLLITIGVSYALWVLTKEQTEENIVSTSCLNVTIENENDDIRLSNTFPITDEEGLKSKPYSFSVTNNCEDYADYTIKLEMLNGTTLSSEYVKIALSEKGTKGVGTMLNAYETYVNYKISGSVEGRKIKRGKLKPSESKEYELRIWLDEDVTKEDKVEESIYKSKVIVESVIGEKPYTESILNGTDPVIDGDLIPITISEEDGKVTRADETKKWYSYAEQKWANAVILRDGIEDPGANEPIDEADIESYFVWIPRYRYEIFDEGNYEGLTTKTNKEQIINIEFESKDEEVKNGSTTGEWLTHPAFTSFDTNGIWVGKFETGYAARQEPTTGYTATNELCSTNSEACNEYGGVSKAGVDGTYNTNYFNKASVVASTTGNFSGIYDMSGGAWEYMMSGIDDNSTGDGKAGKLSSGRHNLYNSGFIGKLTCPGCNDTGVEVNHDISEVTEGIALPTDERFFEKYDYSTSSATYNRGFLGDATKEIGPFQTMKYLTQSRQVGSWYNDEAWFVYSGYPWVKRGGGYTSGTGAGLFGFVGADGRASSDSSFRFVLAV